MIKNSYDSTEEEDFGEDVAEEVGELFYELLLRRFSPQHLQRGTLEAARLRVQEAVHEEIMKLL